MKRFLVCLGSLGAVPAALAGVKQAALTGQPDMAVACAVVAIAAAAAAAWITAQVGMAVRTVLLGRGQYRGSRWNGRDGSGWR